MVSLDATAEKLLDPVADIDEHGGYHSFTGESFLALPGVRRWRTKLVISGGGDVMVRWPAVGMMVAALVLGVGHSTYAQVTWNVDNTANIGGNAVTTVIGSPTVVSTPFGNGLKFDGNDGVIVNANPIAGAATFTIEMLFRPDPIVNATSNQPRILHVQSSIPPDHRATLEGRIENGQWYLDAFLRSQRPGQANASVVNSLTLIDATKLHPLGQWYNFTMTYDGAQLRAYVNSHLELSGPLAVLATASGQTSLGMRHNQVNFFEGVIAKVRFTPSVVNPTDFLSVPEPTTLLLFTVGLLGLAEIAARQR